MGKKSNLIEDKQRKNKRHKQGKKKDINGKWNQKTVRLKEELMKSYVLLRYHYSTHRYFSRSLLDNYSIYLG